MKDMTHRELAEHLREIAKDANVNDAAIFVSCADAIEELLEERASLMSPAYEFECLESYPDKAIGRRVWASVGAWLWPGDELGVRRAIR